MSTLAFLGVTAVLGSIVWLCVTETPAIARTRVDEDEPTGRGPGEF